MLPDPCGPACAPPGTASPRTTHINKPLHMTLCSNDLKCHHHRHKHRRRPPIIISRTICIIIITSALLFLLLHLTSISGTTGKAPLYCQTLGGAINSSIHMHQPKGSFSIKNRTQRSEGLCWQRAFQSLYFGK